MSIGDKWNDLGFGSMDKESSFKLLDTYFDLGVCQSLHFLVFTSAKLVLKGKLYRHCEQLVRLE
jgi:hypothetical protein